MDCSLAENPPSLSNAYKLPDRWDIIQVQKEEQAVSLRHVIDIERAFNLDRVIRKHLELQLQEPLVRVGDVGESFRTHQDYLAYLASVVHAETKFFGMVDLARMFHDHRPIALKKIWRRIDLDRVFDHLGVRIAAHGNNSRVRE